MLGPAYRLFYDKPVHLVRGLGTKLFDADGNDYLDAYNNVASVGHCHPHVIDSVTRQLSTLNTHTRYLHEGIVDYSQRLLRHHDLGAELVSGDVRLHRFRGQRSRAAGRGDAHRRHRRDRHRGGLSRQYRSGDGDLALDRWPHRPGAARAHGVTAAGARGGAPRRSPICGRAVSV